MIKCLHGSGITGRERGVVTAYTGDLREGKWTNLVDATNPAHTGVQRQVSGSRILDKPTHFPPDVVGGVRNYISLPKYHDYRTGGMLAFAMRSRVLGGVQNRMIQAAYGGVGPFTYYYLYLGPANVLNVRFGLGAAPVATGYTMPLHKWVRTALVWTTTGAPPVSSVWVYVDGNQVYTATGLNFADDMIAGTNLLGSADGVGNVAEWEIADVVQANTAWTATEVLDDYLHYAVRTRYLDALASAAVTAVPVANGPIPTTVWNAITINGTAFAVVDAPGLHAFAGGLTAKSIRCTGRGYLWAALQYLGLQAADPEGAYGTFAFCFKKAGATASQIAFISDSNNMGAVNGYVLQLNTDESVSLERFTGGASAFTVFSTAAGAIPADTWFEVRIARRYDGRFSVYVNNRLLVAAAGSNPGTDTTYTAGSYVLLHMRAGDEFSLLSQRFGEVT